MDEPSALAIRVALIGIGATLVLDIWSLGLQTFFRLPFPNYPMIGRWIGYFPIAEDRLTKASTASRLAVRSDRSSNRSNTFSGRVATTA
jgi:hypothetical protein